MWARPGKDLCLAHDPESRALAQQARAKAGRVTAAVRSPLIEPGLDVGEVSSPPTNRAELRDLVARAVTWTLTGKLDPKRAAAVIQLAQRGMTLFPEAPDTDPHDQMDDQQLRGELLKELRAVESRIRAAGSNGHGQDAGESPLVDAILSVAEATDGADEPLEAEHDEARWPEVEP